MRLDHVEQSVLGEVFAVKTQFAKNRFLVAQQGTQRHACAGRELTYQGPRWKGFKIFNDMRLDARVADEAERIARRAATGIMVDNDIHRIYATRPLAAPSVRPVSGATSNAAFLGPLLVPCTRASAAKVWIAFRLSMCR